MNNKEMTKANKTQPEKTEEGNEKVITKKDLDNCGVRWLMAVNTFNYEGQLSASVVFALSKVLRKLYPNDDDYVASLNNHYKYFNTTPPIAGLLLGAALAVEEKGRTKSFQAVQDLKVGLMGSMAGIGDTIFWILTPTIFGSIAGYMAQQGNPIGMIIWIAFCLAIFFWRIHWFNYGYKFGIHVITNLGQQLNAFTEAASVLGLSVVGALIPSVVVLKTGLTFQTGSVKMALQSGVLDKIFPAMLPILATWIVYKLIHKKVNMTYIILGIIVIAMIGAATGILSA